MRGLIKEGGGGLEREVSERAYTWESCARGRQGLVREALLGTDTG
jgi:hypothetical protein